MVAGDVATFDKAQQVAVQKYIKMCLAEHFAGLMQVVGDEDENESLDMSVSMRSNKQKEVNIKLLDAACNDFVYYYKQKSEFIAKEIRQTINIELAAAVA